MPDLVLYDGECGLCGRATQFILRHDRRDRYRFTPLQGPLGHQLLEKHRRQTGTLDTVIVLAHYGQPNEALLDKASAALHVLISLGGLWNLLRPARWLPSFLTNAIYDWVARHRYGWFGHADACQLATPEQRAKFL